MTDYIIEQYENKILNEKNKSTDIIDYFQLKKTIDDFLTKNNFGKSEITKKYCASKERSITTIIFLTYKFEYHHTLLYQSEDDCCFAKRKIIFEDYPITLFEDLQFILEKIKEFELHKLSRGKSARTKIQ